jgi:hypothetical protein
MWRSVRCICTQVQTHLLSLFFPPTETVSLFYSTWYMWYSIYSFRSFARRDIVHTYAWVACIWLRRWYFFLCLIILQSWENSCARYHSITRRNRVPAWNQERQTTLRSLYERYLNKVEHFYNFRRHNFRVLTEESANQDFRTSCMHNLSPAGSSGGSNPGLGARGLEPFVDFCGREKELEPLARGSSF